MKKTTIIHYYDGSRLKITQKGDGTNTIPEDGKILVGRHGVESLILKSANGEVEEYQLWDHNECARTGIGMWFEKEE